MAAVGVGPGDGWRFGTEPVNVTQFVHEPVLSAAIASSTPLSAPLSACCQLAACAAAFAFCEAM